MPESPLDRYFDATRDLLARVHEHEADNIRPAADVCAESCALAALNTTPNGMPSRVTTAWISVPFHLFEAVEADLFAPFFAATALESNAASSNDNSPARSD